MPDVVGARRTFWVRDVRALNVWDPLEFELAAASSETAVWVDTHALGVYGGAVVGPAADSVLAFADVRGGPYGSGVAEGGVATVRRLFGPPPDSDGDGRLDILLLDIADGFEQTGAYVAGFFDPNDLTDRPYSNRRDILYLDLAPTILYQGHVRFTEAGATLAHEFQHLVHAGAETGPDPEAVFLNEGLSELAEVLAGFAPRSASAFASADPRPLFSWSYGDPLPDYARASLWTHYLFEQVGEGEIAAFVRDPAVGQRSVEALLARTGGRPLDRVVEDWAAALIGGGGSDDPRYRYHHPLRQAGPVAPGLRVRRLPGPVSLPAPPLSVAFAEVPLAALVRLDGGPATPPTARATIAAVYPNGPGQLHHGLASNDVEVRLADGDFGTALVALTTGSGGDADDRWEVVLTGRHSAREEVLAYDDGTADAFAGSASYLLVGPDDAVALAFGGPGERWLQGVDLKVIFLSELHGGGVPQGAERDLVIDVLRVRDGRLDGPIVPARRVAVRRPLGNLRFEPIDLRDAFAPLHAVRDSFAVVLRNDDDDPNHFAVALDQNGGPGSWRRGQTNWQPLTAHPTVGSALAGFAPMVRARTAAPCTDGCVDGNGLPAPQFSVGPDSVVVVFEGVGPVDPAWSTAYARSGGGRGSSGALTANGQGLVRYAFRVGEVGPATFAFSLIDAASGLAAGAVFTWAVDGATDFVLGPPFPNPGRGDVAVPVSLPSEGTVSASLVDALGRTVAQWPGRSFARGGGSLELHVPPLASGLYLLRVTFDAEEGAQTRSVSLSRLR